MNSFVWLLAPCALVACGPTPASHDPDASTQPGADATADTLDPGAAVTAPSGFSFDGPELVVCGDGSFHAPTLAMGAGRIVVGCLPAGSQLAIPQVKFMTQAGALLGQALLLTSDGYYYKESRLSYHNGKFQVIYEYNCDDNGSWLVGWGWGCIELREYYDTGDLSLSLQFGEIGHNGHPVLDANGGELGVGWVSYDAAYFRRIGPNRELVGGRGENQLLGPDPLHSDARSDARTQIAYDGAGYGVFTIIGTRMYFSRVEMTNHVPVAMKDLGNAYSQTFSGQFAVVSVGGTYYVAYDDMMHVKLVNFDRNGDVVKSVVVQGHYLQPQLVTAGGRFYVITEDAGGRGYLTVYNANLDKVADGLLGGDLGRTMTYPTLAVDGTTWAVAYQDMRKGSVRLQRLTPLP